MYSFFNLFTPVRWIDQNNFSTIPGSCAVLFLLHIILYILKQMKVHSLFYIQATKNPDILGQVPMNHRSTNAFPSGHNI